MVTRGTDSLSLGFARCLVFGATFSAVQQTFTRPAGRPQQCDERATLPVAENARMSAMACVTVDTLPECDLAELRAVHPLLVFAIQCMRCPHA